MASSRASVATPRYRSGSELLERLTSPEPLLTIELRPPRRDSIRRRGLERWIDMYHAIRDLSDGDTMVFTTDNAVGAAEEESLRHLHANLGSDADLSRVLPFLTIKHSFEYCLRFPDRALDAGHRAVVVLGGDRHRGPERCVEHASELRAQLRQRSPGLALGGWANPYRDPTWQIELLKREEGITDFFLTQVVSHHDLTPIERFLDEMERQNLRIPALFGVFFYRSGNAKTLDSLSSFLPTPVAQLSDEFASGASAEEICGRTLEALRRRGISRVYLCNIAPRNAAAKLGQLERHFS